MKQTDYPMWRTDRGLELIRLDETRLANVAVNRLTPESLEELAEACVEAAAALRERSEPVSEAAREAAVRRARGLVDQMHGP